MKNNTEKNFLDNFYNDMNSKSDDYQKEDNDEVVYDSFSEINCKGCFNLERMIEAIGSESFKLPAGLSIEEKRQYILSNEDIKLKNIDDKDKIEVIKSLLDNK